MEFLRTLRMNITVEQKFRLTLAYISHILALVEQFARVYLRYNG